VAVPPVHVSDPHSLLVYQQGWWSELVERNTLAAPELPALLLPLTFQQWGNCANSATEGTVFRFAVAAVFHVQHVGKL